MSTVQISQFRTGDVTTYTHRECSLNPLWVEPDWEKFDLITSEEAPIHRMCDVCSKPLSSDPPYQWSRMSVEEVQRTIKQLS